MGKKNAPLPGIQVNMFIESEEKNPIQNGINVNILSARWFEKWKALTGYQGTSKKPDIKLEKIDNSHLFMDNALKATLTEDYDYIVVSKPTWDLLHSWYGGGPVISVEVIENPETKEPYPIITRWRLKAVHDNNIKIVVSHRYELISSLKERICQLYELNPARCRLVDYWNRNYLMPLPDTKYLYEFNLINTQEILVEVMNEQNEWPKRSTTKRIISRTNSTMTSSIDTSLSNAITNGLVGMINLGNTCYLNSSLQCLIHTKILMTYFLNYDWRKNVNLTNRRGTAGVLVNSFAALANEIWMRKNNVVNPKDVKSAIDGFAPRFKGSYQHDSQELLLSLLDGLHEDMNKIKDPVYTEGIEGDGANDIHIAEASWRRHKRAHESRIVDIFHGQLRSEIRCAVCGQKRVVFDPYVSITLPLITEKLVAIRYLYVPLDLKKKRPIAKIYVKPKQEEDNISDDVQKRFGEVQKIRVIPYENVVSDFRVHVPDKLKKIDYFAFEISPDTPKYMLASIQIQQPPKQKSLFIEGPILIPTPKTNSSVLSTCQKRLQYLYEPTEYPFTDQLQRLEKKTFECIVKDYAPDEKFKVHMIDPDAALKDDSIVENISEQSIRININPLFACRDQGFSWGALLPLDREYDTPKPVNEEALTLMNCIENLSQETELDDLNEWFCPKCKKFVTASAKIEIWSVPDVLIFHLKRFSSTENGMQKLTTFVDYALEIDMANHIIGPVNGVSTKYQLYAVINHLGILSGGHYTSTYFSEKESYWTTFNDETVYKTPENGIITDTAYVLFYQRK